jgi:hypothetical protein
LAQIEIEIRPAIHSSIFSGWPALMEGVDMKGSFFWGLAIGVGAAVAGPGFWRSGRPAAKKALRAGLEGYVVARRAAARMVEEVEDLVAEVAHEMKEAAAEAGRTGDETIRVSGAAKAGGDE